MSYKAEIRQEARSLYAQGDMSVEAIATHMKVPKQSIVRWKREDAMKGNSWDRDRAAVMFGRDNAENTAQVLFSEFMKFHSRTLGEINANSKLSLKERVETISKLTDAYLKQLKACALAAPPLNKLAIASEVVKRLAVFVSEKHPDAAPTLLAVLEPFGAELAKKYG
jgi:transposase-like protein